jgi:hypothetical protein
MESGQNARAVDFARFGLIFLHQGRWNGSQIVPSERTEEATVSANPDLRDWEVFASWREVGGGYAYH